MTIAKPAGDDYSQNAIITITIAAADGVSPMDATNNTITIKVHGS